MDMIFARSEDNIIAVDGELPWRMPSDLRLFKKTTIGKTILMGRKTFDSLGQKCLPGRETVVFSRSLDTRDIVVERTYSRLRMYPRGIVVGGTELYQHCIDNELVDTIYVSVIDTELGGVPGEKTLGPEIDTTKYTVARTSFYQKRPEDQFKYRLEIWKKR